MDRDSPPRRGRYKRRTVYLGSCFPYLWWFAQYTMSELCCECCIGETVYWSMHGNDGSHEKHFSHHSYNSHDSHSGRGQHLHRRLHVRVKKSEDYTRRISVDDPENNHMVDVIHVFHFVLVVREARRNAVESRAQHQ